MDSLSTLFPDQPPKFEPHITISNDIHIDLDDPKRTKDDVYRILSASLAAINSLPKNHTELVTLENVGSKRKYLKKLYFKVKRDPNLVSFARIIRELFVVLPSEIESENRKINPHLYTVDDEGNTIRKSKKQLAGESPEKGQEIDVAKAQKSAQEIASKWSTDEYDPHLSLVYSDIYPINNALWLTIKTRIQDFLNINDCDVEQPNGLGWNNGVIKLVLCEGDVNEWIDLGSVDLH